MTARAASGAAGLASAAFDLRPRPAAAIAAALRQRAVLGETGHRPWPLPDRPWFMGQTWRSLLFAHWRVDGDALARVVPAQIPLDLYDGSAWIGVTPFRVEGLRLRRTPPPPLISRFPELNVRTYVDLGGKPGIYFFSLDAGSEAAVRAARRAYRLPYYRARISIEETGAGIEAHSTRASDDGPAARFKCRYSPVGARFTAGAGSLEHWLTERYCLYTLAEGGTVQRAEIQHPPWPLQRAGAEITENTMASALSLELDGDPLLHYAARQDVLLWAIEPVPGAGVED